MTKTEKAKAITEALKELYPDAVCALDYGGDPWRLLIMARLSAQCTDKRVNEVCRTLFEKFPTAKALAEADITEIENAVRPCGLFRVKARDIQSESRDVYEKYGRVPDTMEELLAMQGVGRKIANLILGDVYGKDAIVTDTHCIRICGKLGFYSESEKNPYKIERILKESVEPSEGADFCHRLVTFGREICTARSPKCQSCPLRVKGLCEHGKKGGVENG